MKFRTFCTITFLNRSKAIAIVHINKVPPKAAGYIHVLAILFTANSGSVLGGALNKAKTT